MADSPNPMIEKLRKLIAHERSARSVGNLHEAEAFAAKVQDLLTAHKLSMSEVDFETRQSSEWIDWERVSGDEINVGSKKTRVYWRTQLAHAIAKINGCETVLDNIDTSFFFVGMTSDRQMCKILYIYLVELGEELCQKASDQDRDEQHKMFISLSVLPPELRREWSETQWTRQMFNKWMSEYRLSWKNGFAAAVSKRLIRRYEETLAAQADTSANAIVHIKRDALAVQQALKGKIKSNTSRVGTRTASGEGFERGQNTGLAVNLSPHTFGTTGRGSRLLGS